MRLIDAGDQAAKAGARALTARVEGGLYAIELDEKASNIVARKEECATAIELGLPRIAPSAKASPSD